MNWKNIDLNSPYESSQAILDPYTFDSLLLECEHNIKDINNETVTQQFETELKIKIESARQVFKDNLNNIVKKATDNRDIE